MIACVDGQSSALECNVCVYYVVSAAALHTIYVALEELGRIIKVISVFAFGSLVHTRCVSTLAQIHNGCPPSAFAEVAV